MNLSVQNIPPQLQDKTPVNSPPGVKLDLILAVCMMGQQKVGDFKPFFPNSEGNFSIPNPGLAPLNSMSIALYAYQGDSQPPKRIFERHISYLDFFKKGNTYCLE